ncbi:alpha/beta-hydrolase [Lentinus brumalis]|uniref:Alpha/beta-hydrolase n=1 Tax=Lentinus brumalis TaxID=2498619 RepID=A0A371CR82_9APHY|nr:alpha/beta-hydrolase [Polyporus brumalis]
MVGRLPRCNILRPTLDMLLCAAVILPLIQAWLAVGSGALQNTEVQLDEATVIGISAGSIESFLGIPYAQPPTGNLRLQLPQLIKAYNGTLNATVVGNQCVQQALVPPPDLPLEVLQDVAPLLTLFSPNPNVTQSEDCLNLNVIRPANVSADAKLPVLFWIYGGGFVTGSNAMYALLLEFQYESLR